MPRKIALITASTAGIGFSTASEFIKRNVSVIILSRREKNVRDALCDLKNIYHANGLNAFYNKENSVGPGLFAAGIACNVDGGLDNLYDYIKNTLKIDHINYIISNAATSLSFGSSLHDVTDDQFEKMWRVNVFSTWKLVKIFSHMVTESIVIVGSVAGFNPSMPIGVYGMTKTALIGLTKTLANELENARVNCVAPGIIKTKFSTALWDGTDDLARQSVSLRRWGEPEEIAKVIYFLSSQDSSYINGEVIVANGGSRLLGSAVCRL